MVLKADPTKLGTIFPSVNQLQKEYSVMLKDELKSVSPLILIGTVFSRIVPDGKVTQRMQGFPRHSLTRKLNRSLTCLQMHQF